MAYIFWVWEYNVAADVAILLSVQENWKEIREENFYVFCVSLPARLFSDLGET